jgi:spore germination protein YaaH
MYDYPTLLNETDELWVMSWGLHWSTSEPGASADVRWVGAVADWVDSLVNGDSSLASKVTIGRSLYSQDWHYVLARVDVLSTPALLPGGAAVPMCDNGTRARPRPLPVQPGDTTVTLQWICTIGFAELREYQPARKLLKELGAIPTYDEPTSESYAVLPSDIPGEHRELWFSDYRSIEQFAPIALDRGYHVGLWRLGLEDQRVWTSLSGTG